jgi:hypothetical protein
VNRSSVKPVIVYTVDDSSLWNSGTTSEVVAESTTNGSDLDLLDNAVVPGTAPLSYTTA